MSAGAVKCADCGWRGRRVLPSGAYQAKACPFCFSHAVDPVSAKEPKP